MTRAVSVGTGLKLAIGVAVIALASTGCSSSSSSSGGALTPNATIFAQNFQFHDVPTTLPHGVVMLLFQNQESFPIEHEMIPIALPTGKTAQDVINDAKAKQAASEDDWLHIGGDFGTAPTNGGLIEILNLPPGNYAFACWQTGTQSGGENGPTHASKGMVQAFTVS